MADSDHHHHHRRRLILHNFLSPKICDELQFIHKSCSTVGYRPNLFSTTLPHLIATNSAHLIIPLIPIRDKLKEKVEQHFGCEYELFIEFTGLISWCKGSSIGWHSDDNRDYLKQRHFAVVCYLNSYGVDFDGGLFKFQDGEPESFAPMAGDAMIYTADERNVHCVEEIMKGERITFTMWFTRDVNYDEDAKVLRLLSEYCCSEVNSLEYSIGSCFPVEASKFMYWFPPEKASAFESGSDIRCGRLNVIGFDICSCSDSCSCSSLELLKEPLYLARGDELLASEFVNILHALQVVQFYCWTKAGLISEGLETTDELKGSSINNVTPVSELQRKNINCLRSVILKDDQLAHTLFGQRESFHLKDSFDKLRFSVAVSEWEAYTCRLRKQMVMSLPYWITHQSIFSVAETENEYEMTT